MNRSLIAIAILGASGSTMAQSTVTLYGKIDAAIMSNSKTTAAGVTTDAGLLVNGNGLSFSRWGLRGSEDLGGGLKANFKLEQGFNIDDGSASVATRAFHRAAWVGISGDFGSFSAGRQYTPYDDFLDAQDYNNASAIGAVFAAGVHADPVRMNNSLLYATPTMGGFSGGVMYAPGEDGAPGVSAGRYTGFGANYSNGPLTVRLAQESITAAGNGGSTDSWILGGAYDLTAVKLFANYERASGVAAGSEDIGWALSASAPLGSALKLSAGYARESTKASSAAAEGLTTGVAAQLVYDLSKRTNVYGAFLRTETTAAGASASSTARTYRVGLRHDF